MVAIETPPGAERPGNNIEFVVESVRDGAREMWLVTRDDAGARLVVEAGTLRRVGVLQDKAAAPNRPAGFNPYFDPPIAD